MVRPARLGPVTATEPVVHELPPLKFRGDLIPLWLAIHRSETGQWRGRLLFGSGELATLPHTADIFRGMQETDIWHRYDQLPTYALRNLYRAVATDE